MEARKRCRRLYKSDFESLGLRKNVDYYEKTASPYMQEALKGASKTIKQSGTGKPDFTCEKYKIRNSIIPIVIESKLGSKKLVAYKDSTISFSQNNVAQFALNGALHYARAIISSEKYKEAIAIAVAGNSSDEVQIAVYYVFGSSSLAYKDTKIHSLDFLQSQESFKAFYQDTTLTELDKHEFLAQGKALLSEHSKKLNKLMHNHNITAPQRVLYVSGMILAMQKTYNKDLNTLINGLSIDDLQGSQESEQSDGDLIYNQIQDFLKTKIQDDKKLALMLDSFREIKKDPDRNKIPQTYTHKAGIKKDPNDAIVAHLLQSPSSINKQIFAYIYTHIYSEIDGISGHLDIMGEMYSEFLKYALGDGKELGIVLTPPYVTKMMAQILDINENDKVMDLATGSAGFLISAMELMIDSINTKYGKETKQAKDKIITLKKNQLLGIEYNAEMFTLATTNMILRGDGSSQIHKANTFETDSKNKEGKSIYDEFKATKILLNPPFTWEENGMPFIAFGLKNMKQGLGAIIIQDSAGSGKAIKSNKEILKHNTLLASIKMPIDLFQPMAGVQTSIYIFEANKPHDYEKPVKFIDFRNDGFKRTKRALQEIDSPTKRYSEIIKIYKAGKNAKVDNSLWNLDEIYIEDFINDSGADWNFDQHKIIDSKPSLQDFKKCVSDYLAWEVSNVLKKEGQSSGELLSPHLAKLENKFKQNGGKWEECKVEKIFHINTPKKKFNANTLQFNGKYPYVARGDKNNGIRGYIDEDTQYLNEANTISFGQDTATMFYQPKAYFTGDKIKIFSPKGFILNRYIAHFLISILKRAFSNFSWGSSSYEVSVLKNIDIKLPTQKGKIAFEFMEQWIRELETERIRELETERIRELEAYLRVTGLKDYRLNDKEKQALQNFAKLNNTDGGGGFNLNAYKQYLSSNPNLTPLNTLQWREFSIGELFSNIQQGARLKQADHIKGNLPFVMSGTENTGISSFIGNENARKFKANALTIDIFGNVFYRNYDFGASDDVGVFWNNKNPTKEKAMLFLCAVISKSLQGKFNFGHKLRASQSHDIKIQLPTNEKGEIAFEFMENFIKAIEKEVIKSVVLWSEKRVNIAKTLIQ